MPGTGFTNLAVEIMLINAQKLCDDLKLAAFLFSFYCQGESSLYCGFNLP